MTESEKLVGPVLNDREMFAAVTEAAEVDNPDAELLVEDQGGYFRVQAPYRLRLTRSSIEDALGRSFDFSEFEPYLSAFSGHMGEGDDEDEMVFYLEDRSGDDAGQRAEKAQSDREGGRPRRKRTTTWSEFPEGRKPGEYEIVTHGFNYHFRRQPAPFEMDPETPLNKFFLRHREGSPFMVDDWEEHRDPSRHTYRTYVAAQRKRETYLDSLTEAFELQDHFRELSEEWVETVDRLYLTARFSGHVLQMLSLYVSQMAPTSYITVAYHFQAGDEMRRIQRIAYLAKALAVERNAERLADSARTRKRFEEDPAWQPMRELLERLLVRYDWGEALIALSFVAKPSYDALFNQQFSALARRNGDEFLAQLTADFDADSQRHQETARAIATYAVERNAELEDVMAGWLETWRPRAAAAIEGLSELFGEAPTPMAPAEAREAVRRRAESLVADARPA